MTTQLLSLMNVDRIDALERHVEDLLHQKKLLQNIESYTEHRLDFGDLLETYSLLIGEIERLQKDLREKKHNHLLIEFEG